MTDRVKLAEQQVHHCLNYGGAFHDGGHTRKDLKLTYEQGDRKDDLAHLRRFAKALNELADAL